ncbi:NADPH-dependent methylglyoxal reductase GRE2 [Colletotrichum viniferum]|nr:NADPH-dependent methylglyoxal reductase GRE2 [Colletotrichum viniferum]
MASTQTLLVTGANGYIGTHVVGLALERGYTVRATARSESSFANLRSTFPEAASSNRLTFAIVPDITKRIANVSSFASVIDLSQGYRAGYVYNEKDWNPMTYEEASKTDSGVAAYCASKGLAESAMWKWMGENKDAAFTLANICPPWVFGPYMGKLDFNRLATSVGLLWKLVGAESVFPTDFAASTDVKDVAQALLNAIERPEAAGERFIIGTHFDWQTAADILREEVPELKSRVPEGRPGYGKIEETYTIDTSKAEKVLGIKPTPLEVTLKESIHQMLAAEKASKSA